MPSLDALAILTSPAILFFCLGLVAALARSDLALPDATAKALSLYLMLCIGFKGGVEARHAGLTADFAVAAGLGVALSAMIPLLLFVLLRRITRLDRSTVCALAATYGSVSVVTFAAGVDYLAGLGLKPSGHMAAVLALMETPAILTALLILRRHGPAAPRAAVLHEVFLNAASVLLIGSFLIGLASGSAGMMRLELFVGPLFQGALCLFLLDLGLRAARRILADRHRLSPPLVAFALMFPLPAAIVAMGLARLAGLSPADGIMLGVLAASGSYIAVPAAMRLAAPEADEGVYTTASLALTFPFNLVIGIPAIAVLGMAIGI